MTERDPRTFLSSNISPETIAHRLTPTHPAYAKRLHTFEPLKKIFNGVFHALSSTTHSSRCVHLHDLTPKSMAPTLATRRPSRNGSSEHVLPRKKTTKRGLKRRASREAANPRALKRARRDEPGALSLTRRPRQLQVAPVSNSQKRPTYETPLTLFVWGCGDDGSFGLGPDHLEEIPLPQHLPRKGIASIAAGGLYTLLLDRDGEASTTSPLLFSKKKLKTLCVGLVLRQQRQLCSRT